MFNSIFEILTSLGLPGIFVGVFLEAIGLPFPGSMLVALAGFMSKQGTFPILLAWQVCLLGYLLGSFSAFMLGRHIGDRLIKKWGRYIRLTPKRLEKARKLLQKSGVIYIIGGRFVPTIGNITPYVAGISGIHMLKFLIYDMIHAIIWLGIFLTAGAALGDEWHSIIGSPWMKWGAIGGGILLSIYVLRDLFLVHSSR